MLRLRPHHIIDIVRNIGNNRPLTPHPYGHLVHKITQKILDDVKQDCRLVIDNDDICGPCIKLDKYNRCTDILPQLETPVSKQEYNDELDRRILDHLKIEEGSILKIDDFLRMIAGDMDKMVNICTHPKEDPEYRRNGLLKGLKILGITMTGQ